MTKIIVSGLLGFLTIPAAIAAIACIVFSVQFLSALIGSFGMASEHYTGGILIFVGVAILTLATMPFWP